MIRVILQLAHPDADILIVFSQHRLAVRIGIDPRCDHALWRIIAGCHIFRRIAVGIQRGLLHDGKPVPPVRTGVTVCVFQFLRTPGRQFQQHRRHFQRRKPVFLPELVVSRASLPQMPPCLWSPPAPATFPQAAAEIPRSAALRCKEKHILFCASPEPPFLILHFASEKISDSIIAYLPGIFNLFL